MFRIPDTCTCNKTTTTNQLHIASLLTWWIGNTLSPHGIARVANETRYRGARIGRALSAWYTRDAVVSQEWPLGWAAARVHADGRTEDVGRIRDVAAASTAGARRAAALTCLVPGTFNCEQARVVRYRRYIVIRWIDYMI